MENNTLTQQQAQACKDFASTYTGLNGKYRWKIRVAMIEAMKSGATYEEAEKAGRMVFPWAKPDRETNHSLCAFCENKGKSYCPHTKN